MYRVDACLCCSSRRLVEYPALVSPFLAAYVFGRSPEVCALAECQACGFRFFTSRMDDAESDALYAGYRGERYYRERHRVEFWYTRKVNGLGLDAEAIEARTKNIEDVLRAHVDLSSIKTVLDFGGDRGQAIPRRVGQEKYVFDLSGVAPVEGVTRIPSAEDLNTRSFDLVILNSVLEHCSEPARVLEQLKPLGRPRHSVFYIEVPFERPSLRWVGRDRAYRGYLSRLTRMDRVLRLTDFYSTAFRVRLNFVPPLGFVKMHEHVSFFEPRSLGEVLRANGFTVLSCERSGFETRMGKSDVIACLASLPE